MSRGLGARDASLASERQSHHRHHRHQPPPSPPPSSSGVIPSARRTFPSPRNPPPLSPVTICRESIDHPGSLVPREIRHFLPQVSFLVESSCRAAESSLSHLLSDGPKTDGGEGAQQHRKRNWEEDSTWGGRVEATRRDRNRRGGMKGDSQMMKKWRNEQMRERRGGEGSLPFNTLFYISKLSTSTNKNKTKTPPV